MRKKTLTVGITAFNEELNIQKLLLSLLEQKLGEASLKKIIIISDGSTDKTIQKAKSVKDSRIEIIEESERFGKSVRVNQILEIFSSDVLFLLDADITLLDKNLIGKIVKRINFQKSGLVRVNTVPLPPQNFIERSINFSVQVQQELRNEW